MTNVDVKMDKKKVVITIDLTAETNESESGKSLMIATTHGNVDIGDGIKLGLSCYRKNPEYKKAK